MKRIYLILLAFIVILPPLCAQQEYRTPVKPVKNVILMIPDGTSTSVLAISRWYQIYNDLGGDKLNLDPYLCGLVKTYQSNAPRTRLCTRYVGLYYRSSSSGGGEYSYIPAS